MLIVVLDILGSNSLASWHRRKLSPLLGELGDNNISIACFKYTYDFKYVIFIV